MTALHKGSRTKQKRKCCRLRSAVDVACAPLSIKALSLRCAWAVEAVRLRRVSAGWRQCTELGQWLPYIPTPPALRGMAPAASASAWLISRVVCKNRAKWHAVTKKIFGWHDFSVM